MTPHEAAWALEWTTCECMLRWMRASPGVTVTAFGGAVQGTCCPELPDVDFLNTVHRLLPDDRGLIDAIAAHYRAHDIRPTLELMPAPGFEELAEALTAAGGRQTGFLAVQERPLPAPPPGPLPEGVTIERVGDDLDSFARVLPVGHGVPADRADQAIVRTRAWAEVDGATLYLARVDGVAAAAAVLFVAGDLAYLANASTLEPFRRRGCQTALIQRRLADGAVAACRRACVLTGWGSQSHANMTRAGFHTAYTKAVWRLDRPT